MIKLYAGPTPNGQKVAILLEELALPYEEHHIDILRGDQLTPEFLAINPNNKQPAIVDPDGDNGEVVTLWESCAILVHLAEKHSRFLPSSAAERAQMMKWLFFQASTQGPMFGQFAHFAFYAAEEHRYPYAVERYSNELNRQMGVLDRHLETQNYMVNEYSIADMALLPYGMAGIALSKKQRPHLKAWIDRLCDRPAVQKGLNIMADEVRKETIAGGMEGYGEEHRNILFGDAQFDER